MKRKMKITGCLATLGLILMLGLSGCSGGLKAVSGQGVKAYSEAQTILVAATEKKRYEQVYTEEIWDVVLENGQTFETYLMAQVRDFLKELRMLNLMAEDQEISISSAEKERIRQLSEQYYEGLSPEDIQYLGIALEDVTAMYQEYFLANKVVGTLTAGVDLEVSDSEAKVVVIDQMMVTDPAKAQELSQELMEEGSDFQSIAKEEAEAWESGRKLGRGEEPQAFEEAAFALAAGEVSPIVAAEGKYYLIRCVDEYDEAATEERKTQIYALRKTQVFDQLYSQFQAEQKLTFSDEAWPPITVPEGGISNGTFFTLYQEEFGDQGY